jgi:hypothetical protein
MATAYISLLDVLPMMKVHLGNALEFSHPSRNPHPVLEVAGVLCTDPIKDEAKEWTHGR